MADSKKKKSTTVRTRVVATNDAAAPVKKTSKKATAHAAKPTAKRRNAKKVGYFKGAWLELKQVRWPNRKATWSLTFAVIMFTLFFTALVLLLDAGFKYLFDFIIK